jgi:hypothetical protein
VLDEHHTLSAADELCQTEDVESEECYVFVLAVEYQIQAAPMELSQDKVAALEKHYGRVW